MTDKNLQKLSRRELLEMMIAQGKEIDNLKAELKEAREKLSERELIIKESGSLAEAALRLNKIFEDADKAARQYLDSVRKMAEQPAPPPSGGKDESNE
jgi:chemotaxis regulatin CheY-phosphate phosphatase CheZ